MKRATKSVAKLVVLENNDRISAETMESTSKQRYGPMVYTSEGANIVSGLGWT